MTANPISTILKQERNSHGMTPEQVVAQLNDRGFSISTKALYAYESGTNLPKVPIFLALCDIYNIRDIMGSFGYTTSLCVGESDWEGDQYEDFFNASLLEKVFLLAKWGIPSFEGYETLMSQPMQLVLSDEEINLIKKYRRLDERGQSAVANTLEHEYASLPGEKTYSAPKQA